VQSTAQHQRLPAVYHTNPVIHAFRLFTCAQGCEQACAEVGAWGLQGMKQGGGGGGWGHPNSTQEQWSTVLGALQTLRARCTTPSCCYCHNWKGGEGVETRAEGER